MEKQTLSVIVPIYNEEKTLREIFFRIKSSKPKSKEIILVNDASTDKTSSILEEFKKFKNVKVINHKENYGKGRAIRTGLKFCTGKITIIQDADLEYNPEDYEKIIKPILEGKSRVVYGSRILEKNKKSYLSFYLGGKVLTFISNFLYSIKITDEPTCYKAFSTDLIKDLNLKCQRFEFCPEVTAKVAKRKEKILEVPISYNPRSKKEGKKIKLRDGIEAIYTLIKYKISRD